MTDPNYTAIQVVMDRSGSMELIKTDMEGALAAFIANQINQPGNATIRLVEFDTSYDVVYSTSDLTAVPRYHMVPRGRTALNDAIGIAIGEFGTELAALPENRRPGHVLVIIITDGMENASQEFSKAAIKVLVEHQSKHWNWQFLFLGANQDAVLTGADYGFTRGQTMTYDATDYGTHAAGQTMSNYATTTRSGLIPEVTEQERKAAQK